MLELENRLPSIALAIFAHPDDAEVACGGTLAKWASAGCSVHVLVATQGEKGSTDEGMGVRELAKRRSVEMTSASAELGLAGRLYLEIPDGEVENSLALRGNLVKAVRSLKPDTVICPDPTAIFFGQDYLNHRDHREIGWAAIDAVAPASALPHYFPDAGRPHQVEILLLSGTLEPDIAIDITSTLEHKVAALQCHLSQVGSSPEWVEEMVRQRAQDAGRSVNVDHAETFRRQFLG
ncbi:MAG TPA: PIG-L family deacetylase [Acidimicrobiales bacterium]|nr:PIG-L family deacetylase [Acidimicrobiales bacterium]